MTTRHIAQTTTRSVALALLATMPLAACAQVPVDDSGKVIGSYEPALAAPDASLAVGNEEIPLMSDVDLEVLVGPIALYPDDLLAVVLPASAYPLQIVDAARFLEELERDPSLKPNPEWDDSVVALLNYPEVIGLLNEDIDWTWRLGEAVVSQQGDVVAAIETFRDRAYAAGNLKSDSYQNVTRDEGIIAIEPIADDVIYVPYYEPERVVVYQPRPAYYYYPRSYPVYYYPYSSAYSFDRGYFWGVTTAFTIGWMSDSLNVYHHSYRGHPYYGHSYWDRWWYRRPTMNTYNTTYVRNTNVTINRYYEGDRWNPRHDRRDFVRDEWVSINHRSEDRVTSNRHYEHGRTEQTARTRTVRREDPIEFRERQAQPDARQTGRAQTTRAQTSRARTSQTEARTSNPERRIQRADTQQRSRATVQPTRQEPREHVTPQRETRQEPRERVTPQRETRQEPRERVTSQRETRQEPRERATPQRTTPQRTTQQRATPQRETPQRETRQAPRERAAPQRQTRQEPRESRSKSSRSESRPSESSARKERTSRR